jgi:N utilization substance protein A
MSSELVDALVLLEKEKGISREVIMDAIEAALISAYRRNFNQAQNVRIDLNLGAGSMRVFARKEVVDEVFDPRLEISLEDAQKN